MGNLLGKLLHRKPEPPQEWKHLLVEADGDDLVLVEAVGEAYYQDAIGKACGGKTPGGPANPRQEVWLWPERNNPHDQTAVAIMCQGEKIGHLARTLAPDYHYTLLFAGLHYVSVWVNARITGGWKREGDEGHYGIVLELVSPQELVRIVESTVSA